MQNTQAVSLPLVPQCGRAQDFGSLSVRAATNRHHGLLGVVDGLGTSPPPTDLLVDIDI